MKETFFVLLLLVKFTKQIVDPYDQTLQKPTRYSPGIKSNIFQIHQNYSRVHHHNPTSNYPNREDFIRPFPVYSSTPPTHQVYILNGTRLYNNPQREILNFNKQKRSPKTQAYKTCPRNATGQFVYDCSCNQFLNCWKGRGFVQNCPPGTLFNPQTLECDFAEKVQCISGPRQALQRSKKHIQQIGCPNGFTGLIPNYTDCSKFINCVSGIENFMECPPGTLFDVNKNICDFQDKADCFTSQTINNKLDFQQERTAPLRLPSSDTKCPEGFQGLYPHSDCSKFLNCANGQTFVQDCSPGTRFNPKLKICDFPYNVQCQNYQTKNFYEETLPNNHNFASGPNYGSTYRDNKQHTYNTKPTATYQPVSNPYYMNYGNDRNNHQFVEMNPYKPSSNPYHTNYGNGVKTHVTQANQHINSNQNGYYYPETHYNTQIDTDYNQKPHRTYYPETYIGTTQNQPYYPENIGQDTLYNRRNPEQYQPQGHNHYPFFNQNQYETTTEVSINHPHFYPTYTNGNVRRENPTTIRTRPIWSHQNPNFQPTTINYDQIVNINHLSKHQSSDYDDTYGSNQRYIRSTTAKHLEKHWPPPFPSTDTNADYVFEYEEVTLEADPNSECPRKQFSCVSSTCIPENLVCNGHKDCLNGKDEENCLEYVAKFAQHKNHKLAVLEKERHDNCTIAACAIFCIHSRKFQCKAFNYRKIDKTCFLTDTNIGLTGALISYYPFDFYELEATRMNCSKSYVCANQKCIDQTQICDGKDDCGDRMDEKNCQAETFGYSVRLTGGRKPNEGQIEVTAFGRTGFICDDQFGLRDGNVACRELGFKLGAAEIKANSFYSKNLTKEKPFYMMDDLNCLGNETRLLDCDFNGWGIHNCLGEEIVGVVCKTPEKKCKSDYWKCETQGECLPLDLVCDIVPDCSDGSDEASHLCNTSIQLRLVNGSSPFQGRVEIRYKGIWGTICDDDFNEEAAKVVCKQLGYKTASIVKKEAYFGSGSGPIWLDQVFCTGNESTIEDCSHWNWGEHNCEHEEDVGVICSNSNYQERHTAISLPKEKSPKICGLRNDNIFNDNSEVHFRVVKGSVARKGDYPWQAAMRVKTKTSSMHWCGAVIISERFLLTAAHCLIGYPKGAFIIVAGDYNLDEDEATEQEARIEDFYIHEDFRKDHKMNNDIALIKLKGRGFVLDGDVQAICLPDPETSYETDQNCTISGFGSIESGKSTFSHHLRAGWIPLQRRAICTMPHVYGDALTDGMICAGSLDEGVDSCDGDSGGPLACLNRGTSLFTLYGVTSWGQHCGFANKPGVYVKVSFYRNWIDNKMQQYSP